MLKVAVNSDYHMLAVLGLSWNNTGSPGIILGLLPQRQSIPEHWTNTSSPRIIQEWYIYTLTQSLVTIVCYYNYPVHMEVEIKSFITFWYCENHKNVVKFEIISASELLHT